MAENTLRIQVGVLQGAGEPTAIGPEMQAALSRYLQLADRRDQLALQLSDTLEQTRKLVEQQEQLLASLQPVLTGLEMAWKQELLVRPPSEKPRSNSPAWEPAWLPCPDWVGAGSAPGRPPRPCKTFSLAIFRGCWAC